MKPRVLIVDDNPLNIRLAAFVLGGDGFTVESALDATQALVKVDAFKPHVILMDIQMPGIDGLSLTERLKEGHASSPMVIVAFTAFAMKGDEDKMRAAGCDGYIAKPIDVARFSSQVRHFIGVDDAMARSATDG